MNKLSFFLKSKFPVLMFWCGKKKCLLSTLFYRNDPKKWSIRRYKKKYGEVLNIDSPSTFFEKMNYLKIYYHDEDQTLYSDKYRVKKVVEESPTNIVVPKVLFAATNIRDLKAWFRENKDTVKRFVIKTNHSCGDIFIYQNGVFTRKYGIKIKKHNKVFRMLKIALKYNHFYTCFERNYKDIKPVVFVEEFIDMDNAVEYEFMTNFGEIRFINVVKNRQSKEKEETLIYPSFEIIEHAGETLVKPQHLTEMEAFIKKYAKKFPFCRVDFIENKNGVYFCEFTFVKSGGIGTFGTKELNQSLGELIDISSVMK